MKHLEVSSLRFDRANFHLQASFSLERGATGIILGPSGCGKTTLLRCIAGLEMPGSGSIVIDGNDISALPPEKRNLGFIFQDLALFDHLTGRKNIEFGLKLRKVPKPDAMLEIESLAEKLKIESLLDRKPFSMSGGEKQRLALARAIATKPRLLLMDEPLSSLDAPLRRELRAYLRSTLSREGMTALHVTHDVEEALELGDEIFMMNQGKIMARGTPRAIIDAPPDAWCIRFLGLGFLLPIKNTETIGETGIANTLFGRFAYPIHRCNATKETMENGKAYFFVPKRAASLLVAPLRDHTAKSSIGILDAVVERIVFQGTYQKVVLLPIPAGTGRVGRQSIVSDDLIELELDSSAAIAKGQRLQFALSPEKCSIVPWQVRS